jgi:lipopolysaccharide transport system ATP-binding protein
MSQSDVVIRVEDLGKKYKIKHEQQVRHNTLRDAVAHQATALGRWANPFTLAGQLSRARHHANYLHDRGEEDFWALKNVCFEIRRGERVGIIGRNGAGKSTLLKILSRITEPTTGRVEIRGRVASLLEVGTGFHPELTGRENIYLNGAILGMTRREIRLKFDEIVDFAEVEKFLDTPVKRYSSGMYVRLAFAVAAHLEPEILVVDEVLAVGDASFQTKCLGKMEDVAERDGRTVLFVSHQMAAITRLCNRCLLLGEGRVIINGVVDSAIRSYMCTGQQEAFTEDLSTLSRKAGLQSICFRTLEIYNDNDRVQGVIQTGSSVTFRVSLGLQGECSIDPKSSRIALGFFNDNGVAVVLSSEMLVNIERSSDKAVRSASFNLHKNPLTPGLYRVVLFLECNGVIQDWIQEGLYISVEQGDYYGSGKICPSGYEGKVVLVDYSISLN